VYKVNQGGASEKPASYCLEREITTTFENNEMGGGGGGTNIKKAKGLLVDRSFLITGSDRDVRAKSIPKLTTGTQWSCLGGEARDREEGERFFIDSLTRGKGIGGA